MGAERWSWHGDGFVVTWQSMRPDEGAAEEEGASRCREWDGGFWATVCRILQDDVADLLLATDCVGCARPGRSLCVECRQPLAALPRTVLPAPAPPELPLTWAVAAYSGPVRAALVAHKDRGVRGVTRPLANALASALVPAIRAAMSGSRGASSTVSSGPLNAPGRDDEGPDSGARRAGPVDAGPVDTLQPWVIPVPTSRAAVRARGDDPLARLGRGALRGAVRTLRSGDANDGVRHDEHADDSAARGRHDRGAGDRCAVGRTAIARIGRTPDMVPARWAPVLRVVRHTTDQAGLDAAARQANVNGAFTVPPAAAASLASRPVVLVDDVITTGSTLAEAARAVRCAEGVPVAAAVVAATRRSGSA